MRGKMEKHAMSPVNKIGNKILSLTASILFFKRTTDLCTGYWGFKIDSLKKLKLTAEGFNLEADLFSSVVNEKNGHERDTHRICPQRRSIDIKMVYRWSKNISYDIPKEYSHKSLSLFKS